METAATSRRTADDSAKDEGVTPMTVPLLLFRVRVAAVSSEPFDGMASRKTAPSVAQELLGMETAATSRRTAGDSVKNEGVTPMTGPPHLGAWRSSA
jgi:hypothetical protein